MSQTSEPNDERPCLHCLIGDLIDDYYGEFGSVGGATDTIDTNELLLALAKTFAELTYESDATQRQRMKEDFLSDVAKFETEFNEAQLGDTPATDARH